MGNSRQDIESYDTHVLCLHSCLIKLSLVLKVQFFMVNLDPKYVYIFLLSFQRLSMDHFPR